MSLKDEMMTDEQAGTTARRPSFLGRFLRALIKVMFWLVILAALGIGGYFGVRELSRTLKNLSADSYITLETAARVDLLRSDVNSLMENETAGRREANAVGNEVTALEGRVTAVEGALEADLDRQGEQLAALEGRLDELAAAGTVISDNVSLLNGGIGALQADIVGYGTDLDNLGGEVDGLQAEVQGLSFQTETLQESLADPLAGTEDVAELRQILVLFRVWELVSRARLRLVEGNPGLALTDVQAAQTALTAVIETGSEELAAALLPVQQRLDLAAASLPADPETAARDLETGWDALDGLLGEMLGLPETAVQPEEVGENN